MSESPTPGLTVSEVLSNRKSFASRYSVHEITAHSRSFTPTEETLREEEEENVESLLANTNRVLHLSSSPEPIEQEEENLLSHSGLINNENTNTIENECNINNEEEDLMNTADNITNRETNSELVPWIWWSSKENSPSPEPQTNAHNEAETSTKQERHEYLENKKKERLVEEEEKSEQIRRKENNTEETIEVYRNFSANVIDHSRSMSLIHEGPSEHVHRHTSVSSLPHRNVVVNINKTKDESHLTEEQRTENSQHQQEELIFMEQIEEDAIIVNNIDIITPEEQKAVVTMQETSMKKTEEILQQQQEEQYCILHWEVSEEEIQPEENKELELKGKETDEDNEAEEKQIPTQAELERLSSMWVPCPLSGFPPRYRNGMSGYYCTYCTYSVCEDCYKLIPRALLHSNPIDVDSNNKKSVVNSSCVVNTDLSYSPISLTSSLECTSPCNTTMEHHHDHHNSKCHLCKKGYLIHEEVLLHEWSCEGPMPAIRLKRGANIVYDTNLLQRYYYIKEQREKRATSHEPLVAHYHGMTQTPYPENDKKQQKEQHQKQTLFQVGESCNVHPLCYSLATNRPYCVQEGQSCVFAVDNYRLTVPCVWCAITLMPTSSSSSSSLFQQTVSGMEELSQEHTLCHNNKYKYSPNHDVIYYAYSITPLCIWKCPPSLPSLPPKPFVLSVPLGSYYKHHIHALALYELSEIYHKVSTQFVPLPFPQQEQQQHSSSFPSSFAENLFTHNWNSKNNNNKIECESESLASSMFSFAHDNLHKINHMTSIPLANLTSVKVLPSQMLSALLVVNVLHNDGYHMTQIQRQRQLQVYKLPHEFYGTKRNINENKKINNNNTQRIKQLSKKRKRERVEEELEEYQYKQQLIKEYKKDKTACNHINKVNNDAVTTYVKSEEREEMEMPNEEYTDQDIELIEETMEVIDHIKAGRHVAVFGLGSKHFFLHHVAHSASLLHYSLCIIDPVYVNNNNNSNKHASVFNKPVNILCQIREIDDYLHKQQEKKEELEEQQLMKLHEANAKMCNEQAHETKNNVLASSAQENNISKEEKTKSNSITDEDRLINVISVEDADEDEGENGKENKCHIVDNYYNNNKYKTPMNNIQKSKSSLQRSSASASSRQGEEHMTQEMINRNVNVVCPSKKADVLERNAHNTTNTTNNVSKVKMLNYKTYHFSHLNHDKEETMHFTWPAITFANKSIKQNVFAHVQKVIDRQRSVKCVKWNALPSFLYSTCKEENISKKNETEKLNTEYKDQSRVQPYTNSLAPSSLHASSVCKLLVVIHNIDQLAESAIRHLAQLCSKWMHSPFAFQIICSFDDIHWLNLSSCSSSSSSLSELINTLSTTLIVHNLHSLIVPRVHEHQHIHPMHLLTEYEGITGNGVHNIDSRMSCTMNSSTSSLGMHARLMHSSLRNAHKGRNKRVKLIHHNSSTGASAPLHDTMRRILFSLPDTFTELLRIMLLTQEDAGDGVYLSLFHHVEQFENNGLMVSQGRLKALQRELISNRLASYNSAEHSIVIHQHRRLQRVLDEVSALRKNNNNKNMKNDTNSATIHVENGLADVTN